CSRCSSVMVLPLPPVSPLFPYTTLFRSPDVHFEVEVDLGNAGTAADRRCRTVVRRSSDGDMSLAREHPRGDIEADPSGARQIDLDRKSTRLNSSHVSISYAVFCLKKKHE